MAEPGNKIEQTGFSSFEYFYLALQAYGEQQFEMASRLADQAAGHDPENALLSYSAAYLKRILATPEKGVYATGDGFSKFIRGGGNISLYQAVSQALRKIYEEYSALKLLDIGAGDGLALLPALTEAVQELHVLEPSPALLGSLEDQLNKRGVKFVSHPCQVQELMKSSGETWDLLQATFSLQSIRPEERSEMFRWMRKTGKRLVMVEFDVPEFSGMFSMDRVQYVFDRYQRGLLEYGDTRDAVAFGFLIPVMFGYFDKSQRRVNFEQPMIQWVEEIRSAGFSRISTRTMYEYWWGSAFLIDAK